MNQCKSNLFCLVTFNRVNKIRNIKSWLVKQATGDVKKGMGYGVRGMGKNIVMRHSYEVLQVLTARPQVEA
jgi:hypothetical protein